MESLPFTLAANESRCYNDKCEIKHKCLRWIHREDIITKKIICPPGGENCPQLLENNDVQT